MSYKENDIFCNKNYLKSSNRKALSLPVTYKQMLSSTDNAKPREVFSNFALPKGTCACRKKRD